MLFMVIERFRPGQMVAMAERFRQNGRMLPDGVTYHASWLDHPGTCCYQVMEADSRDLLDEWIDRWNDLVDFDVIPVLTSAEFWAKRKTGAS